MSAGCAAVLSVRELGPSIKTTSAWRKTQPYAAVSNAIRNIVFGGAPYGATQRVRDVPARVRGVPKWVR
eukprot:7260343-Pyramimonas_sp.AAC.1